MAPTGNAPYTPKRTTSKKYGIRFGKINEDLAKQSVFLIVWK